MDPVVGAGVLSAVPTAARLAFHQSLGTLTDDVNRTLEARPDLAGLIGVDNLDLMRDNHANHASFMDNVFFLGNFKLLARIVPWVYRVYTARGFSLDYFPVELQAWADAIGNRLPSHLSEPILNVYAWMIRHHGDFAEQARLPDAAATSPALSVDLGRFVGVFLEGDFKAAERLTKEALGESPELEEFYLWILDPVMREIGRLWEHSLVSSAQEHVASALVTRMMSVAYSRIDRGPTLGKRVVACSGPHEQHQIGAWMVSDLLEARGWDARLLGADPSPEGLLSLLDEFRPAVLALSVTVPFHLRDAAQLIESVRRRPGLEDLRIMVGGQAFAMDASLATAIGADGYAPDARSAALLAEGWWEEVQR
jgi:methanogenic corrinoid protein MtbC1